MNSNNNPINNLSLSLAVVSLQEFEAEYQELWDWLMDMDAMVTDSHQLMMSEEQRHHLYKVRGALLCVCLSVTNDARRQTEKVPAVPKGLSFHTGTSFSFLRKVFR